jgi:phage terminase small subunit
MIVAERKLTAKQQRFCDEYLIDCNATQAAIRTGYSEKTAYSQGQRLLKNVEVKTYIEQRMAEKEKNLIADQDEVLKYLTSVLRGESESEEIVIENIGDFTSEARTMKKAPSEKDRLKAAELLGKRYSLFKDNVKLDVTPVVIGGDDGLED